MNDFIKHRKHIRFYRCFETLATACVVKEVWQNFYIIPVSLSLSPPSFFFFDEAFVLKILWNVNLSFDTVIC